MFINVKGILISVKCCLFLDGILKFIFKMLLCLWINLFVRVFLRSLDYFGLIIRLVILNILLVIFVNEIYFVFVLVFVFNYLLLF